MKKLVYLLCFILSAGGGYLVTRSLKSAPGGSVPAAPPVPAKPKIVLQGFVPEERFDPAKRPVKEAVADLTNVRLSEVGDLIGSIIRKRKGDPLEFLDELNSLPANSYWETSIKGQMISQLLYTLDGDQLKAVVAKAMGNPDYLATQIQLAKGNVMVSLPLSYWIGVAGKIDPQLEAPLATSICREFKSSPLAEKMELLDQIRNNATRDDVLSRLAIENVQGGKNLQETLGMADVLTSAPARRVVYSRLAEKAVAESTTAQLLSAADQLQDQEDKKFIKDSINYNASRAKKPKGNRN